MHLLFTTIINQVRVAYCFVLTPYSRLHDNEMSSNLCSKNDDEQVLGWKSCSSLHVYGNQPSHWQIRNSNVIHTYRTISQALERNGKANRMDPQLKTMTVHMHGANPFSGYYTKCLDLSNIQCSRKMRKDITQMFEENFALFEKMACKFQEHWPTPRC